MATNGIDFVISGKNLAGSAFDGLLKSLQTTSTASIGFGKSFAIVSKGLSESLANTTNAVGSLASSVTQGLAKSIGTLSQSVAKSIATIVSGSADAYAKVSVASARASKIESTIKPALKTVEKSLQQVEEKTNRTARATEGLYRATTLLAGAYAAIKSGMAVLGGLDKINSAYALQTKNVKDLNSALSARGASGNSKQMQDFAASLQKLTGVGDEVTIGLMQQALALGYSADAADDATKAAIGLAEATGKTAEQSLGDMKDALQGNFEAFYAVNPQIMYMRTNQQKLAAVLEIANQGLKQQSGNMLTVEGSGRRASGAFGNLLESIGAIIAPIRVLINAGIQKFAETMQSVLVPAVEYANEVLKNIGPVIDWVREKVVQGINIIISAFTFLEVIVTNLGSVWELMKAVAERAMIQIVETVKYSFTDVIPAYLMWFGENIINLMKDAWNGVIAVVTNAGKILGDLVYTIFEFIASGGEGGIDGLMSSMGEAASRSLLDGFKSSLTDLPEIAGRTITDREKELTEIIGLVGANLGQEFADKLKERLIGVGDTVGDELAAASGNFNLQGRNNAIMQGINAQESRLLTRGPGSAMSVPQLLERVINVLGNIEQKPGLQNDDQGTIDAIKKAAEEEAKRKKLLLVPVK